METSILYRKYLGGYILRHREQVHTPGTNIAKHRSRCGSSHTYTHTHEIGIANKQEEAGGMCEGNLTGPRTQHLSCFQPVPLALFEGRTTPTPYSVTIEIHPWAEEERRRRRRRRGRIWRRAEDVRRLRVKVPLKPFRTHNTYPTTLRKDNSKHSLFHIYVCKEAKRYWISTDGIVQYRKLSSRVSSNERTLKFYLIPPCEPEVLAGYVMIPLIYEHRYTIIV